MSAAQRGTIHVVESRIVGATLFSESAHVTRRAAIGLERGLQRIALSGLPSLLDPGSLRVSTTRGQVRAIETDTVERKLELVSDTTALEKSIDALRAKRHRLTGELEALNGELNLINQVVPGGQGGSPAPLRPDTFLAGLDVLARRRQEAVARLRAVEAEAARTDEELSEMERRLGLVGQTGDSDRKQSMLVISVDVPETGDGAIDLTYEAAWATWRPYYHVRLSGKENTVECVRFADIWQETGEDWQSCRLRLSTAEPEAGLQVPVVLPWSLGVAKSYEDKLSDLYSARRRQKAAPQPAQVAENKPMLRRAPAPSAAHAPPPPARMSMKAGAPMRARGGFGGAPGGGGAYSTVEGAAPMDTFEDDVEESSQDLTPAEQIITANVGMDELRTRAAGSDEFQDYARQFEEEGVFRETTAAGVMAMRSQAVMLGASSVAPDAAATMPPAIDGAYVLDDYHDEPAPPAPPSRGGYGGLGGSGPRRRGPSPEHPDYSRLHASRLPKDSSGGINHEFEVGAPTTCLSGKERQRLSFGSVIYPARIEYLLRPAVTDHAFGRVTVVNSELVPMLAGPAAIFVGEAFFGETEIRTTPAGGKLILDLGAETAIKSARRTKTTVRTEGILTKEDVHVVEVSIDIENYTGQIVELEVQDQVPISKDSKVKVRLVRTNPKDAALDELTGILTFKLRAPSGMKTELSIVYEIEAPKDYQFRQMLQG